MNQEQKNDNLNRQESIEEMSLKWYKNWKYLGFAIVILVVGITAGFLVIKKYLDYRYIQTSNQQQIEELQKELAYQKNERKNLKKR